VPHLHLLKRNVPHAGGRSFPRAGLGLALVASVPLALSGCGDLHLEPEVQLVAPETTPSLQFRSELPSLPDVVDRWGRHMALSEAVREWEDSWEEGVEHGDRTRDEVRRAVAKVLAGSVSMEELSRSVQALDLTVRALDHRFGGGIPPGLVSALDLAREDRDLALAGLEAGDAQATLRHLMAGGDRLLGVTPATMATGLIRDVEQSLRRTRADDTYSEQSRRAQRLMEGARSALDDGSPVLALKRAWYAALLLEESAPDESKRH